RRPQTEPKGTCAEEARTVCGILDRVGEGEQLWIEVVLRQKQMADPDALQAGSARSEDAQRTVHAAVGAAPQEVSWGTLPQRFFAANLKSVCVGNAGALRLNDHPQTLRASVLLELIVLIASMRLDIAGGAGPV